MPRFCIAVLLTIALAACGSTVPRGNREPGDLRWSLNVAHPSVPVAGDGKLYVAAEAGPCADRAESCPARIMALDQATGALRWELPDPAASRDTHIFFYDGIVYAGLRGLDQTLVAIEAASGHELWRYGGRFINFDPVITPQLIAAPDAAADGNAALTLLDRLTGTPIALPAVQGYVAALAGDGNTMYVMLRDGRLMALDGSNAAIRWQVQTRFGDGYHSSRNTTIHLNPQPGALIVQARPADFAISELDVYDIQTGARTWTAPFQLPDSEPPPARDGLIYLRDISSTLLQAFELSTGTRRWQYTVGSSTAPNPVFDGPHLLVASPKKGVAALDAATGAVIWGPLKIGVPKVASGGIMYGVSEMSGIGFMPLSTGVFAYDSDTGKLRWSAEAQGMVYRQQPVVTGGAVYLPTETHLYALGR